MKVVLTIVCMAVLGASGVYGQTPKAEPAKPAVKADVAPQLKPEVELELTKARMELYEILLTMKTAESQYQEAQKSFNDKQSRFATALAGALDKSGLDKNKYEINPGTFAVTLKPAVAEPAKKP